MAAPRQFQPVEVANASGARSSYWWQLGDQGWRGSVFRPDGGELTVEETSSGWKVIDVSTQASTSGRDLLQLLKKAVAR